MSRGESAQKSEREQTESHQTRRTRVGKETEAKVETQIQTRWNDERYWVQKGLGQNGTDLRLAVPRLGSIGTEEKVL